MKKTTLILLLTSLLLCRCDDGSEKLFELHVDSNYGSTSSQYWVILHNASGDIIDFKSFIPGDVVSFQSSSAPDKLSVTLFEWYPNAFNIESFLGVPSGMTWSLTPPTSEHSGTRLGDLHVTVEDPQLGNPYNGTLSSERGDSRMTESSTNFNTTIDVWSNVDYLIVLGDNAGNPRYKFIEEPFAGNADYTFADFNTFNKTSTLTLPQTGLYSVRVEGYKDGFRPEGYSGFITTYWFGGSVNPGLKSSFTLGFLDQLQNHKIRAWASYYSYSLGYEWFGSAAPSSITLLNDIDVQVTNRTLTDFSLSSDDFDWYSARYESVIQTPVINYGFAGWTIWGTDRSFKNLREFPEVIRTRFPELVMDEFEYIQTNVYRSSQTLPEFASARFGNVTPAPYEQHFKGVY